MTSSGVQSWGSLATSADGTRLVLGAAFGWIYTWQTTATPLLDISISRGNAVVSWIVPSMDFALQQNSNLDTTNWTTVTTPPVLNYSHVRYELSTPLMSGNLFFRLVSSP